MISELKITFNISLLLILICSFSTVYGQENATYKMELIKVNKKENRKKVTVVLKVTPTIENFQLMLSTDIEYSLGDINIATNVLKNRKIQTVIYGDDFRSKSPELSSILEEDVILTEDEYLIVFNISKIKEKIDLSKGYFKYGLWESNDLKVRNEQTFYFSENINSKN